MYVSTEAQVSVYLSASIIHEYVYVARHACVWIYVCIYVDTLASIFYAWVNISIWADKDICFTICIRTTLACMYVCIQPDILHGIHMFVCIYENAHVCIYIWKYMQSEVRKSAIRSSRSEWPNLKFMVSVGPIWHLNRLIRPHYIRMT